MTKETKWQKRQNYKIDKMKRKKNGNTERQNNKKDREWGKNTSESRDGNKEWQTDIKSFRLIDSHTNDKDN